VRALRILAGALLAAALLLAGLHLHLGQRRARGFDPAAFRAAAAGYRAEIVRDPWGVPHLFGRRDADVAFGLAWAHAEDDVESYEALLPLYRAEQGLDRGRAGAAGDYLVQLLEVREAVEEGYERELSAATRARQLRPPLRRPARDPPDRAVVPDQPGARPRSLQAGDAARRAGVAQLRLRRPRGHDLLRL
jgi:acyl-homoserine lactone acylase PvdQ